MGFFRDRRLTKLKAEIAYQTALADDYENQLRAIGRANKGDLDRISKARASAAKAQSLLSSLEQAK